MLSGRFPNLASDPLANRPTYQFAHSRSRREHVLTDSWTSFGVVGGLGLVLLTHWKAFDPIVAIAVAAYILWSGGLGLALGNFEKMDYSDPKTRN